MANKLIVAAAGSGKTEFLVKSALAIKDSSVLVTTYTDACAAELTERFIRKVHCVPANVSIIPWYTFLLRHGVRPFQTQVFEPDIINVNLVPNPAVRYIKSTKISHYIDENNDIYTDKLSKFVLLCNDVTKGLVIKRISRIFRNIFVDEMQDLAGYDLNFIEALMESSSDVILVGDPRQAVYATNHSRMNSRYKNAAILGFFENLKTLKIDDTTFNTNHRSVKPICDLSNELYPSFPPAIADTKYEADHQGLFLVRPTDVETYLRRWNATQLRNSKDQDVDPSCPVLNFGVSKGKTIDRVLIYPTDPIAKWIRNRNSPLKDQSRAKLYVAITRARFSVAFVYDFKDGHAIPGFINYAPN